KTLSLKGKTVALTRPAGQAEGAGKLIAEKGGVPYYIPAIEIKGLSNYAPIKKFITELCAGRVDYVILMSTNGVKYLFSEAEALKLTTRLEEGLAKAFVVAVGPKTAEALKECGAQVDLVPTKYSSQGLIECFQGRDITGKRIRIPRTSNATPILTDNLRKMGSDVEEIYVYESGLPEDEKIKANFYEDLVAGKIDAIVFGSGLSSKNIFKMLLEKAPMGKLRKIINAKVTTVAIGPTTAEALREMGVKVDVMPQNYLFEDALSSLARYWNTKQKASVVVRTQPRIFKKPQIHH
ncbi:MAG TPA: uroporphyrinogen-III synthase, partial [Candidatus Binatia bacterium]|nr:uroporphyrinogen-III synthase [Candidatus Binatia bacterium]